MAYQPQRFLGLEDVRIATSDGEDIGQYLSSIRYSATISAYEIRERTHSADAAIEAVRKTIRT